MLLRLFAASALSFVATAAIPAAPVWPANACTDKSLSIPSWVISNFRATGSDVSFHLLNRASNYEGSVTCTRGTFCTAASNPAIHVTAQISGSNAQVTIDDTWSCNDKRNPITVHATGSSTIVLTAGGTSVFPQTLVRGSILTPVTLTPAYPDPPTGYDLASCSAKSATPSWTVTNTELRNITEFYIDPQTFQYVFEGLYFNTTITNDNTGFSANCAFTVADRAASNPGPVSFDCTPDVYNRIGTTVTWDQQTGEISLNQTWYCIEDSKTKQVPSAVSASGTAKVPLSCAPDETLPEVIHCTNAHTGVPGTVTERADGLPVFSLTDPAPTTGGCTVDTLTNASWTLDTFRFFATNATDPWTIDTFYMYFYLNNARIGLWTWTDVAYPMLNTSNHDHTWNEAVVTENFDVQSQYKVYFVYDYGDNSRIDVRQAWECSDKDPAHPLLFNATGTTHLSTPPCIPWNPTEVFCKDDNFVGTFAPTSLTYTVLNA